MKFNLHILVLLLAVLVTAGDADAQRRKKKVKGLSYEAQRKLTELFYEASKEKMLGNFEEAAQLYHECLKIDSKNAAAYYEIANIITASNQTADALPFAQKAMNLDPDNEWYSLFVAQIHIGLNDYESASKVYERLVKKDPGKVEFQYDLANTYLFLNKFEDAIKAYNKVEEIVGVSEDISVQKEKLYLQMDRLEDAVKELENLIENFPGEQRFLGMLAEVYIANDLLEDAFSVYQRMLKNDSSDPILHLSLAEYYKRKGEYDKSFSELKQAFESSELNIDNKVQVMMSYYSLTESNNKLIEQAYELLDLMTKAHPKDAKAFAMKADFLLRDKRLEESREAFYQTVALDSSRFAVWSQLINVSYEMYDFEAMEKDSKTALELFPNQGALYLFNGIANNYLKNHKAAAEILSRGEIYSKSDTYLYVQIQSVLGDVYNTIGDFENSDIAYSKALKRDPSNPLILNNYSYYLSLRNEQLDRAEEMSKKANILTPREANYQDTYAWILYQQGKYESALEWINKALENGGGKSGIIVEHHGDILYKLGDKDGAMAQWKAANKLGKTSDDLGAKIEGTKTP